jgi:hypothetical protein
MYACVRARTSASISAIFCWVASAMAGQLGAAAPRTMKPIQIGMAKLGEFGAQIARLRTWNIIGL